jgi:hypothetical protein
MKSIYINQEIKQLVQIKDKLVHELNHKKETITKFITTWTWEIHHFPLIIYYVGGSMDYIKMTKKNSKIKN